ncbi:restriction endonuclease subunit S [Bacillus pumilus]|uniref:Restriction endonuclease subunit S n=1 Tax=Bacillus pumilus TaxID=1408 RepID=A0A2G8IUQ2_BACPU|nr:restriction endonuclease subunit S [Bacillus pumilus]PIK27255.1 restriction endonuclease subunit S [Bacillus pumilus]
MSDKITKSPPIRFAGFTDAWEQRKFGEIINERREKTKVENEDILLSSAIEGMYLNSELFSHFRGTSNIGYLKIRKDDMILSAQNLHLGNCNINKRFEHGIISPAYKVYSLVDVDADFMHAWIKKDSTKQFFEKATTEGASVCRKNIEWRTLYNQKMYIPIYSEQQKIGAFFKQIDDTMTFHQRKLELLKDTKKSLLQKMFPKDGADVPDIRFAEFTDAWEQRRLGEVAEFSKGNGYTKNDLRETGFPVVLYGRLYTKYETIINNVDTFVEMKDKSVISEGNEVVVPSSGESAEDISRASVIGKPGFILGGDLNIIKPKQEVNSIFLALTISNGTQQKEMSKRAQGKSVVHLHNSDLKEINLLYPKLEEQKQIGTFFNNLDNLIILHQRELNSLKDLKKSLLQQMFI